MVWQQDGWRYLVDFHKVRPELSSEVEKRLAKQSLGMSAAIFGIF